MFTIVPIICFILIFFAVHAGSKKENLQPDWRSSVLLAAIIWGALLTVGTEILSIFNLITFGWVLGFWALAGFVCMLFVWRAWRARLWTVSDFQFNLSPKGDRLNGKSETVQVFCIAFIVVTVGLIAILAPPSYWDSLSYRMSCVFHWIQNRNIAPYPTHTLRQLTYAPGLSFIITHFQILSGGDYFANLAQWFCMLGSIIAVSLIAKELGAGRRGQVFSAFFCVTIPMGILQGATTQGDYAATFWMACFVYYVLLISKRGPDSLSLLKAGLSLGLALLTREIIYIYAIPFLIWFIFSGFKKLRRRFWKAPLLLMISAFFLNIGYYTRNFGLWKAHLGFITKTIDFTTGSMTVPLFISNIVRNAALHLGTPLELVNHVTYEGIKLIHALLGVSINDSRITCLGHKFYIPVSLYEGDAGNFLHFILIISTIFIFFIARRKEKKLFSYYPILLVSGFFMFCFFFKWAPWHSRYHLPIFVLFSPFVGMTLSGISNRKIINFTALLLILLSLPWLFFSTARPLIFKMGPFIRSGRIKNIFNTQRIAQYFIMTPQFEEPYREAVRFIKSKGCSDIGIISGEFDLEYLFIALFQETKNEKFHIEHVNVTNSSSVYSDTYPFNDFSPSAIISLKPAGDDKIINRDTVYAREWSSGPVSVFIKR